MGFIKIIAVGLLWFLCMLLPIRQWYRLLLLPAAWFIPSLRDRAKRNWVADDQCMFTFLGGKNPDHTISGHVGITCRRFTIEESRDYHQAKRVINTLFFWQKDHCDESIEWDEVESNSNKDSST